MRSGDSTVAAHQFFTRAEIAENFLMNFAKLGNLKGLTRRTAGCGNILHDMFAQGQNGLVGSGAGCTEAHVATEAEGAGGSRRVTRATQLTRWRWRRSRFSGLEHVDQGEVGKEIGVRGSMKLGAASRTRQTTRVAHQILDAMAAKGMPRCKT